MSGRSGKGKAAKSSRQQVRSFGLLQPLIPETCQLPPYKVQMSKSQMMPSYRRVLELLERRNETRAEFESALHIASPYMLALAAPRYVAVLRELECAIESVEDSPIARARRNECLTLEERAALDGVLQEQRMGDDGSEEWAMRPSVLVCAHLEETDGR